MKSASFNNELKFNDSKVAIKVILETSFSKEIRILMREGQLMKEHKAPYPIIVHLLKGSINFGISVEMHFLNEGEILTLDANVPHDLKATSESIVRLTLSKFDHVERVQNLNN